MNEFAVLIGIILFPGLISSVLAEHLIVHQKRWGVLKYGIYSFIMGVMSYSVLEIANLIFQAFFENPVIYSHLVVWNFILNSSENIQLSEVALATAVAIPVGFISAALYNRKAFNRFARVLGVSFKYGDENLFSYFLNSTDTNWVYVRDKEKGLTYQGQVKTFSENSSMQEIVLINVTVYGYDDSDEYYSIPKIYLSKPVGNFVIEAAQE